MAEGALRCEGSTAAPPWVAGVVNHRTYADLAPCLASLARQTRPSLAVRVIDHDGEPHEREAVSAEHPGVEWEARPNGGFAGGANALLAWARRTHPDAGYALLLNPDVVLEEGYAESVLGALAGHPAAALASGKLLRRDGRVLDSAGIRQPRHRRPRDRGAGELDAGQYERCEPVFAVSGAALAIRLAALPVLEVDGEVFDEDFFAYHEDTDLAWRARVLGWQSLYVPTARARHGRRWQPTTRFDISPLVRRHSFKNHYLSIVKNERPGAFVRDLPVIAFWEVLRLGYGLVRDPAVLGGYRDALRLLPRAWAKRRVIQDRAGELSRSGAARSS